jgi:hypothetical protein
MNCATSAISRGEARKFGSMRAERFQTKTLCPARRRHSATRVPMMPRPMTPTFMLLLPLMRAD